MNSMKNNAEPFKVFETKEDWQAAVNEIVAACMQQLNKGKQTEVYEKPKESENQAGDSDRRVEELRRQFEEQEAELQKEVPDFRLKDMIENDPEFRDRILKGYSVEEAFYLSNRKHGRNRPEKEKKKGIRENGAAGTGGGTVHADAATMSDKDFKAYIQRIIGGRI